MPRWLRRLAALLLTLALAAGATLLAVLAFRPGQAALDAHRYAAPAGTGPGLYATWFGTTAVLLDDGRHAVLIDPFFTRPAGLHNLLRNTLITPNERRIAAALPGVPIAAVLVSHSHYDHAMDAGVAARLAGAVLAGSASTANVGRGAGLREDQLRVVEPGQPFDAGPFRITFIAARHAGATGGNPLGDITAPLVPPARYLDYRQGGTFSILVEHAAGRVLHHGSAGFVPGALDGVRADAVFLSVALIDDLPAYLHAVVDAVGAKRVVPTHWDDFTRPLDAPLVPLPLIVRLDRFFAYVDRERPDLAVGVPRPGERVRLSP